MLTGTAVRKWTSVKIGSNPIHPAPFPAGTTLRLDYLTVSFLPIVSSSGVFVAEFLVTPEHLKVLSHRLQETANAIELKLAQMSAEVLPIRSGWAGTAQAHFEQLIAEWERSAVALHDALTGLSNLTGSAAHSYETTELAIARSLGH